MEDIDEEGFKSFKIYLDNYNIKKQLEGTELEEYKDIILNSLDKAVDTLQNLLRIQPLLYGYQFRFDCMKKINLLTKH